MKGSEIVKSLDILADVWWIVGVFGLVGCLLTGLSGSGFTNGVVGLIAGLLVLLVCITIGASVQGFSVIVTYFAVAIRRQVRK